MTEETFTVFVSDKAGSVSAIARYGDVRAPVFVLGHGAGAGMNHPFMVDLCGLLAEQGVGTVRFNFPYMEQGRKIPDRYPVASATVKAVTHRTRELFPGASIFLGGKSFGGRMASMACSEGLISGTIAGLIFLGFPLHPANTPSVARAEHLSRLTLPLLFIQGTNDALADPGLLAGVLQDLPRASLSSIPGANHGFNYTKGRQAAILPLASAIVSFIRSAS